MLSPCYPPQPRNDVTLQLVQHVARQLDRAGARAITRRRGRVGACYWAPRTREIVKCVVVCFVPGRARGGWGGAAVGWAELPAGVPSLFGSD